MNMTDAEWNQQVAAAEEEFRKDCAKIALAEILRGHGYVNLEATQESLWEYAKKVTDTSFLIATAMVARSKRR